MFLQFGEKSVVTLVCFDLSHRSTHKSDAFVFMCFDQMSHHSTHTRFIIRYDRSDTFHRHRKRCDRQRCEEITKGLDLFLRKSVRNICRKQNAIELFGLDQVVQTIRSFLMLRLTNDNWFPSHKTYDINIPRPCSRQHPRHKLTTPDAIQLRAQNGDGFSSP